MSKNLETLKEIPLRGNDGRAALRHVRELLRRHRDGSRIPVVATPDEVHEVREASGDKALELSRGSESTQSSAPVRLEEQGGVETERISEMRAIRMRIESIHEQMVHDGQPTFPSEL